MDFDKLVLVAAFVKWIEGKPVTAQELEMLTIVFVRFPRIAAAPAEIQSLLSQYQQNVGRNVKNALQSLNPQ